MFTSNPALTMDLTFGNYSPASTFSATGSNVARRPPRTHGSQIDLIIRQIRRQESIGYHRFEPPHSHSISFRADANRFNRNLW
jgi:hypothetical protein